MKKEPIDFNSFNQIVSSLNEWVDDDSGLFSIRHNINRFCDYEHTLFLNEIMATTNILFPTYNRFSTMTERYMDNYALRNKHWVNYPILCKEYM